MTARLGLVVIVEDTKFLKGNQMKNSPILRMMETEETAITVTKDGFLVLMQETANVGLSIEQAEALLKALPSFIEEQKKRLAEKTNQELNNENMAFSHPAPSSIS